LFSGEVEDTCFDKKKKKVAGSQPGLPGSTRRVDRISPGYLPGGFLLRPGPVPGPGRSGFQNYAIMRGILQLLDSKFIF